MSYTPPLYMLGNSVIKLYTPNTQEFNFYLYLKCLYYCWYYDSSKIKIDFGTRILEKGKVRDTSGTFPHLFTIYLILSKFIKVFLNFLTLVILVDTT